MKSFLAAAVLLATTALGVGHSAAQTGTSSPGSIGTTSPLGSDFGQAFGNSPSAAQTGVSSPGALLRRLPIPRRAATVLARPGYPPSTAPD